jgi:hypothetical protein
MPAPLFAFCAPPCRYDKRLERLRAGLELRRKVEIHELEERKNLHVNDLIRSHEASFAEIKKYYNEITKDNLKSIKKFKVRACVCGCFLCVWLYVYVRVLCVWLFVWLYVCAYVCGYMCVRMCVAVCVCVRVWLYVCDSGV